MLTEERQVNVGPEFMVFLSHHLEPERVPLLEQVKKVTGVSEGD
jgi:hypothetical protein